MRYRDLRLQVKQWIGFGAIVAILAGVSSFALNQMGQVRTEIDDINDAWIPGLIAIAEINLDVSTLRALQLRQLLITDPTAREDLGLRMWPLMEAIDQNRDEYEALIADSLGEIPFGNERRAVYSEFDENWDDYLALFVDLVGEGQQYNEALGLFRESDSVYAAISEKPGGKLININEEGSAVVARRAEMSYVRTQRVIVFVFIGTIFISSLIAAWLVRSVTTPVKQLQNAARKVADGQLNVYLHVKSNDELGKLARSFNKMTASLLQARRRNEEQAETLRAQQVHLRETNEDLERKNEDLQRTMSQLQEAQRQLVVKEKMASLGQLTAGIAHEIKNPLNFVNNFAQLTLEIMEEISEALETHRDARVSEVVNDLAELLNDLRFNARKINEHGKRADNIVRSMLQHSRGKPGEQHIVPFNSFIDEYANLAFHGMRASTPDFHVSLVRTYDETVDQVQLIPQEFGRVIINLLNNAFFAVHEREQLNEAGYDPVIRIRTKRVRQVVEVEVEDNGGGIPEDLLEHIFEPFFTTKPAGQGTGLGLSLSYEIVTTGHSGDMSVENIPGEGATFKVLLPISMNTTAEVRI